jgi:DNA invertase Pin-like site-specific DNA recombinase
MTPAGTKVIGYTRCSTREQGDSGLGLAAQRAGLEREAKHRGWDLVDVLEEVASGAKKENRPILTRALERLRAGEADALLVSKLDRLSRSTIDFATLVEQARKEGWSIVALDPMIDLTTANGEMFASMLAVLAQWERRLIGERTKAALAVRKAEGVRLGRRAIIDPDVRALILEAREQGLSLAKTADMLNAQGIPTPEGRGPWRKHHVEGIVSRAVRDSEK